MFDELKYVCECTPANGSTLRITLYMTLCIQAQAVPDIPQSFTSNLIMSARHHQSMVKGLQPLSEPHDPPRRPAATQSCIHKCFSRSQPSLPTLRRRHGDPSVSRRLQPKVMGRTPCSHCSRSRDVQHAVAYWAADAVPLARIFLPPSRRLRAATWYLALPGGGFSAGTATSFSLRISSMWEGLHM